MKTAIFILALVALANCDCGDFIAQIEPSIKAIKEPKSFMEKLGALTMFISTVQAGKSECTGLSKSEIFNSVKGKLSDENQACVEGLATLVSLIDDAKKNGTKGFEALAVVTGAIGQLKVVQAQCRR